MDLTSKTCAKHGITHCSTCPMCDAEKVAPQYSLFGPRQVDLFDGEQCTPEVRRATK